MLSISRLGTKIYYSPKRRDGCGVLPTFTYTLDSFRGVKVLGRENNHWAVARTEVKNERSSTSTHTFKAYIETTCAIVNLITRTFSLSFFFPIRGSLFFLHTLFFFFFNFLIKVVSSYSPVDCGNVINSLFEAWIWLYWHDNDRRAQQYITSAEVHFSPSECNYCNFLKYLIILCRSSACVINLSFLMTNFLDTACRLNCRYTLHFTDILFPHVLYLNFLRPFSLSLSLSLEEFCLCL